MAGMFVGGVGAAAGATIVIGGAAVLVTTSAIAITWNVLTQGHLTLAVSNEGSSSGKGNTSDEGKGDSETKRVYEPSPKHNPQGGWGSENPIPNNEVGQELLDTAYSSSKNKQLYNIYEGDIIKFQPDSSSGKWHAYKVSNTAKEVPTDVYKKMLDDGLITKTDYNKLIRNNWY